MVNALPYTTGTPCGACTTSCDTGLCGNYSEWAVRVSMHVKMLEFIHY